MSISVASNVDSIRAQNRLRSTGDKLSSTFERLSSGLRITKASDDPAGLQLADLLRANSRAAAVAVRNVNDGISVASTAGAALDEVSSVLSRLYELATQSANSVYTTSQRSALSQEFEALGSEVERISKATTFNGLNLLSNSSSITIQAGITGGAESRITIAGVAATLSDLGLGQISGALSFSINGTTVDAAVTASRNAITALDGALGSLNSRRGTLGAAESRLQVAVNFLTVERENYIAAESRIRDADVASEVAEMVRLQVLQQAVTAVLGQANQQPGVVLKLLS